MAKAAKDAHAGPTLTPGEKNLLENSTIWKLASFGEYDGVKELVDKGISPHEPDERGFTPLNWAARNGHIQVADNVFWICVYKYGVFQLLSICSTGPFLFHGAWLYLRAAILWWTASSASRM